MLDLRDIRQILQFLALTAKIDFHHATFGDLPQRVLFAVFDWLESEDVDSPTWTMLGDATVFALAQLPHHASPRGSTSNTERAGLVWRLVEEVDPSDLPLAGKFAELPGTGCSVNEVLQRPLQRTSQRQPEHMHSTL